MEKNKMIKLNLSAEDILNIYSALCDSLMSSENCVSSDEVSMEAKIEAAKNVQVLTPICNKLKKYLDEAISTVNDNSLNEYFRSIGIDSNVN